MTGAAPIFHAVMVAATEQISGHGGKEGESPTVASASGTERRLICALSGAEAGDACPSQVEEWLPVERIHQRCDWHQAAAFSPSDVAWPVEYRAWAHDRGCSEGREGLEAAGGAGGAGRQVGRVGQVGRETKAFGSSIRPTGRHI